MLSKKWNSDKEADITDIDFYRGKKLSKTDLSVKNMAFDVSQDIKGNQANSPLSLEQIYGLIRGVSRGWS